MDMRGRQHIDDNAGTAERLLKMRFSSCSQRPIIGAKSSSDLTVREERPAGKPAERSTMKRFHSLEGCFRTPDARA
jgi:hypothetical protein